MPTHPRHIVCACALVRADERRILLVRTARRGWELPGGQVEEGESVLDALAREVEEESGVRIASPRLVGVYDCLTAPTMVVLAFVAAAHGGVLRPSDETPEVRWATPLEALDAVTHPPTAMRLRDLLAPPASAVLRTYAREPFCVLRSAP